MANYVPPSLLPAELVELFIQTRSRSQNILELSAWFQFVLFAAALSSSCSLLLARGTHARTQLFTMFFFKTIRRFVIAPPHYSLVCTRTTRSANGLRSERIWEHTHLRYTSSRRLCTLSYDTAGRNRDRSTERCPPPPHLYPSPVSRSGRESANSRGR